MASPQEIVVAIGVREEQPRDVERLDRLTDVPLVQYTISDRCAIPVLKCVRRSIRHTVR